MSLARPVRIAPRSKYHAQPTVVDGIRFASQAEARRYSELRLLERAGQIQRLIVQPVYHLYVVPLGSQEPVICGKYIGDFQYETREGAKVVEDVKSAPTRTALYRLKKKWVEALYGITIWEVR